MLMDAIEAVLFDDKSACLPSVQAPAEIKPHGEA
jgi:hypothetical protein